MYMYMYIYMYMYMYMYMYVYRPEGSGRGSFALALHLATHKLSFATWQPLPCYAAAASLMRDTFACVPTVRCSEPSSRCDVCRSIICKSTTRESLDFIFASTSDYILWRMGLHGLTGQAPLATSS